MGYFKLNDSKNLHGMKLNGVLKFLLEVVLGIINGILDLYLNFHTLTILQCRRNVLEKKLADAEVSEEEQNNLLKFLEKKETEYMRLQRHKMGADDFEPLTMIGKGAFREVLFLFRIQCEIPLRNVVIVPITFTAKISLLKLRLQIIVLFV